VDGTPFGRYRLLDLVGRGGMGEVWRAFDTTTDRIVAIKVLPAHLSDDQMFQQRFRREAHAAARLNTPHVVPIYDYGEINGRLYVCMRLIEGPDLQTVLADGPLKPARAVRVIGQVALALHAAHKVGLVHRDVKPHNILLDENGFAYLIDFGIARAADETRLTGTGVAPGTVLYMAPERLDDRTDEEDARVDIYALCCVLYECLTGRPPFNGTTARIIAAHLNTPPPKPSLTQPNVPARVDLVIAAGMAKDPDDRYTTTVELANAAREAITDPIHRTTPTLTPNSATAAALRTERSVSADSNIVPTEQADWTNCPPTQLAPTLPQPEPAPPTTARVRRLSRDKKIPIIIGAALAAVVAVAISMITLAAQDRHDPKAEPHECVGSPGECSSNIPQPSYPTMGPTEPQTTMAAPPLTPYPPKPDPAVDNAFLSEVAANPRIPSGNDAKYIQAAHDMCAELARRVAYKGGTPSPDDLLNTAWDEAQAMGWTIPDPGYKKQPKTPDGYQRVTLYGPGGINSGPRVLMPEYVYPLRDLAIKSYCQAYGDN